jgi:hypothetical protein
MENINENKYIAFCLYKHSYPHNVIFCKSNLLFQKYDNQFKNLTNFFENHIDKNTEKNIVTINFKKCIDGNEYKSREYLIKDQHINDIETVNTIIFWLDIIQKYHEIHHYMDDDCDHYNCNDVLNKDVILYYVLDENKYLSPTQLYDKLLSMKDFHGEKMEIEQCFMISEKPYEYKPSFILRFFAKSEKWLSCDEITNILKQDKRILQVQPSHKKNSIVFGGFGYIKVDTMETLNEFNNKKFTNGEITVTYDLG